MTRIRVAQDSYDVRYFEHLYRIEDEHFWFRSRNQVIAQLVRRLVREFRPGYHVLEVGCGTGNTLRVLDQACASGVVTGMDLFHEGLRYARQRVTTPLVQADVHSPPFKAQFDLIGLFDVLEHLPDDGVVLDHLHRLLKPDGYLMLTVPAHPSLSSYFDEASHHYRRYEYAELEDMLIRAGYQIEFMTHYMASIFPIVWLGRRMAARFSANGSHDPEQVHQLAEQELHITPVLNGILFRILSLEMGWVAQRRSLPIGTSLLAIARKVPLQ